MKSKTTKIFSTTIDVAPELLVGEVLARLAKLDHAAYRAFKDGRPLAELVDHIVESDQERFRSYVERLRDPKLVWYWAQRILRQQKVCDRA